MNQDVMQGKAKQWQGAVRERWGDLTDDDVAKMKGQYEGLLGVLQERYGYTRTAAEEDISHFLDELKDAREMFQESVEDVFDSGMGRGRKSLLLAAAALVISLVIGLYIRSRLSV